jgi:hypothetical protein
VPDCDENHAHFGSQVSGFDRDGKDRGHSGYPLVKLVTVMALRSHLLSAACFGPYETDERQCAKALYGSTPANSLVLMDRAYLDAAVFHELSAANRHWLTPAKSTTTWRVIKDLGKDDQLVEIEVSHSCCSPCENPIYSSDRASASTDDARSDQSNRSCFAVAGSTVKRIRRSPRRSARRLSRVQASRSTWLISRSREFSRTRRVHGHDRCASCRGRRGRAG